MFARRDDWTTLVIHTNLHVCMASTSSNLQLLCGCFEYNAGRGNSICWTIITHEIGTKIIVKIHTDNYCNSIHQYCIYYSPNSCPYQYWSTSAQFHICVPFMETSPCPASEWYHTKLLHTCWAQFNRRGWAKWSQLDWKQIWVHHSKSTPDNGWSMAICSVHMQSGCLHSWERTLFRTINHRSKWWYGKHNTCNWLHRSCKNYVDHFVCMSTFCGLHVVFHILQWLSMDRHNYTYTHRLLQQPSVVQ